MELNKFIEHTLLKQDATIEEVKKLLDEAIEYNFLGVCVNPVNVKFAKEYLKNADIKVVTVIGFPLGQNTTEVKILETVDAVKNGADEIDMVLNCGKLKDKDFEYIIDENGRYWFYGRFDDIIKTGGYRVGPYEVENVLMEHPAVLECGVTGAPDPVRGQVVKATIVLNRGYEGTPELTKELQDYVKTHTAPYKYPRIVVFREELPKTVSGKIRRNLL